MGRKLLVTITEHSAKLEADRKSTRLNSSHLVISYAVFCLKKKYLRTIARGGWIGLPSRRALRAAEARASDAVARVAAAPPDDLEPLGRPLVRCLHRGLLGL